MDTDAQYPGRTAHWVRHNKIERSPHRWIVADSESRATVAGNVKTQTLRCADAVRWRDDLATGTHDEWLATEDAEQFWSWVDEYTRAGRRTVCWFHNAGYDLRILRAFEILPALGWELEWCNLDRDVSVITWRSDHGTLVIADTWTWLAKPLSDVAGMTGIGKPKLPGPRASLATWHKRCRADVLITRQAVRELLDLIRGEHLGNWQPSGAGMGYAAWRHRFLAHKVLVHDHAPALAAEREAMHCGRAEAWWHGPASGGQFTEWDMHMAYCRIAAECDVPVKLWADDGKPTKQVHAWAMKHWAVLCKVRVKTDVPVVPCRTKERIIWPVGEFETTLWQPELELITRTGGTYTVLHQWRYNMAPALRAWAEWSMQRCAAPDSQITPVQRTWVKHQSRALIGRLALRTASWEHFGANPYGWLGLTGYADGETGETCRMLHIGDRTFVERDTRESDSSLPQITGYIQSVARVRLWDAASAAGISECVHVDTDSLILTRAGSAALEGASAAGLPGGWRRKDTWSRIDVTGPRHYRTNGKREIPGVPRGAEEVAPGVFMGETWESLASALTEKRPGVVKVTTREFRPRKVDNRRPWGGPGAAEPIRLAPDNHERSTDGNSADRAPAVGADQAAHSDLAQGPVRGLRAPGERAARSGSAGDRSRARDRAHRDGRTPGNPGMGRAGDRASPERVARARKTRAGRSTADDRPKRGDRQGADP